MSGIYGEENGETIIPGEIGSNDRTQAADNSGNTRFFDNSNQNFLDINDPAGNTSDNYIVPAPYTSSSSGNFDFSPFKDALGKIDFKKAAVALGGIAGGLNANKGNQGGSGAGYQGGIPTLYAGRNMLSAPPTEVNGVKRRPGSGGIDYGGDVTYFNTKAEVDAQKAADAARTGVPPVVPPANKAGTQAPANLGSKGYQAFIAAGKTPMEYLGAINQWILDNPNATQDQIAAAMKKYDVTNEDLQAALGESNFSDATKYFMTHGEGLDKLNSNVLKWIEDNPYATRDQISEIVKASGVDTRDLGRAFATEDKLSPLMEYALTHGMGMDEVYQNIARYKSQNHSPEEVADMIKRSGASEADIAAADEYVAETKYDVKSAPTAPSADVVKDLLTSNAGADDATLAKMMKESNISDKLMSEVTGIPEAEIAARRQAVGYAVGGMAKGRYLQGETDGMADKLPARIGSNQPAALSHGEFVVPADVVSHLGNGNSDAGAKKLYQMMDKIRMARTGNKKQGKKINPDKFMPGGLAASKYARGGSVKHFETGGITGSESNLSNWAGPYVTDMLGKGKALSEMPYQAYKGPLTAGPSALQTKAFEGFTNFQTPSSIGEAASTAGDYAKRAGTMSYTPQTTDFLGNANRSGLASPMQTNSAFAVQKPMGNQMDPGAAYRSPGMPMEEPMPNYHFGEGDIRMAVEPRTEADWNMHQQMAMYMPGTDMAKAKADFMSGGQKMGGSDMGALPTKDFMPQQGGTTPAGIGGLLQGMGAANAQPAPPVDEAGRPVAMGADGRPIRPDETGGMMQPHVMPRQGEMQSPQIAQKPIPQMDSPVNNIAQQYMNPYLQAALNPQLEEARRQSKITQQENAARMTKAGAFGGGRQAILDAENQRNLGTNLSKITGEGYNTAYDKAMAQFNADQQRKMQESQFGATYGLDALRTGITGAQTQGNLGAQEAQTGLSGLKAQLDAGGVERGIESEGIAADKAQFEEARANPYKMLQFQQSLLQGMPLDAQAYNTSPESAFVSAAKGAKTVDELMKILGIKP